MTILISITICFASRSQSVAIVYVDCNGRIEQLMILNEPSAPVTALAGIAKMLDVFTLKTDGTANDSKKAAGNGTCLLNLDGQFHLQVCNITEKPEKVILFALPGMAIPT